MLMKKISVDRLTGQEILAGLLRSLLSPTYSARSLRTVRAVCGLSSDNPRTILRLLLAGTPAKLESPSPDSVRGQS